MAAWEDLTDGGPPWELWFSGCGGMNLLMMGTGPFAVPTLLGLLRSAHTVQALITRPDKFAPGRKQAPPNPMRDAAAAAGLPIYTPERINSDEGSQLVAELQSELLVVCDYGQILSGALLAQVPLGGINLHGSLLPKYRGAAPIQWALLQGETETGVSVIHMTPRLDGGPLLVQRTWPISPEDDAEQLESKLATLGVSAVLEAIDILDRWDRQSPIGVPQDPALATKAPRLSKQNGELRWQGTDEQIRRHVQAFKPWPGSFTHLIRPDRPPLRIIINRVSLGELPSSLRESLPGTGTRFDGGLWVRCGVGGVRIEQLQPAGKKMMSADEFLRGYGDSVIQLGAVDAPVTHSER